MNVSKTFIFALKDIGKKISGVSYAGANWVDVFCMLQLI
jgi:hypothetical protein